MMIKAAARSDPGRVRVNNEDNLYVSGVWPDEQELAQTYACERTIARQPALFALCDGMGGEDSGEVASRIAIDIVASHWSQRAGFPEPFSVSVERIVTEANQRICEQMLRNGRRMGTTLTMVACLNNQLFLANLGDSRAYMLRSGKLVQISQDHTQVQTMVRIGAITREQAKVHPDRNKLTQHLGILEDEMTLNPYLLCGQSLQADDRILLCSDGLSDPLDDDVIRGMLEQDKPEAEICAELVQLANKRGGADNVSVILLRVVVPDKARRFWKWKDRL